MKDLESKKAIKTYFDMAAGSYSGLLLEKEFAERMAKLLYKQQQEIKELLAANISKTEVSNWTLAYPDGKQTSVYFFNPKDGDLEKMKRIELFTKLQMIRKVDDVFMAASMEEAEKAYMDFYSNTNFKSEA